MSAAFPSVGSLCKMVSNLGSKNHGSCSFPYGKFLSHSTIETPKRSSWDSILHNNTKTKDKKFFSPNRTSNENRKEIVPNSLPAARYKCGKTALCYCKYNNNKKDVSGSKYAY